MTRSTQRLRIIVAGMAAQYPVGGVAWDYLQYPIGLARLGHDVVYHEDTWCWPYDPLQRSMTDDRSYSSAYLDDFFACYAPELSDRWHYLHLHEESCGMSRPTFDAFARSADMFLNVSGGSFFPDSLSPHCRKVFLDSDPGYNQIILSERPAWSENVDRWCAGVHAHDCHFTYAENFGHPECTMPAAGIAWKKTRMPVVPELWPARPEVVTAASPWSTVMTWNVFKGKLEYGGAEYRGKAGEFAKVAGLPRRTGRAYRVAVGGTEAPLPALAAEGWQAEDGPTATLTPQAYQDYIAGSRGEVSVAKQVYVALRTGWFSTRSACYLAASRPVVVQDTGFGNVLPTGRGVHAFTTADEAAAAIETVEANYQAEMRGAREVAVAYFDARAVLRGLIEDAFSSD
ncbi:MAG: glycosyltransferase family 1 protein [Alphaproteobacteria bacterium]|nr:glycosyltransferase family 1 protein [Alphaproteobacteria bacterium]